MITDKRINYSSLSDDDDNCLSCIFQTYYNKIDPNKFNPLCIKFWVEHKETKFLGGVSKVGVCDSFRKNKNDKPKGETNKNRAKEMAELEKANAINIFDVLRIIENERPENVDDTKGNLLIERMKKEVSKLRG